MDSDRDARERSRREAGHRWSVWLVAQMERTGLRQVDLVRRSDGQLMGSVVSKWVRGDFTASPEYAIIAARILGADPVEALKAAGHHAIAGVAAGSAHSGDPGDPVVVKIQENRHLTDAQRQFIVEMYRADIARAGERALATAEKFTASGGAAS